MKKLEHDDYVKLLKTRPAMAANQLYDVLRVKLDGYRLDMGYIDTTGELFVVLFKPNFKGSKFGYTIRECFPWLSRHGDKEKWDERAQSTYIRSIKTYFCSTSWEEVYNLVDKYEDIILDFFKRIYPGVTRSELNFNTRAERRQTPYSNKTDYLIRPETFMKDCKIQIIGEAIDKTIKSITARFKKFGNKLDIDVRDGEVFVLIGDNKPNMSTTYFINDFGIKVNIRMDGDITQLGELLSSLKSKSTKSEEK